MKEKFLEKIKYEYNYSDLTIKGYDYEITKFLEFLENNNFDYKKVDSNIIRKYLKYLDEQKYKKNSISKNLSALRSYYKFLNEEKIILNNPFKIISNPKKDKKLPDFLNYEEINKIFDSIDINTPLGLRNRCIIEILYDTGVRVNELVNLKMKDIDFVNKTINIYGKGNKERIVYYGDYLKEILNKYYSQIKCYLRMYIC